MTNSVEEGSGGALGVQGTIFSEVRLIAIGFGRVEFAVRLLWYCYLFLSHWSLLGPPGEYVVHLGHLVWGKLGWIGSEWWVVLWLGFLVVGKARQGKNNHRFE